MCWVCNAFPARRRRSEQFGIVHKGHQHDQHVRCVRWQLDAPIIGQSLGFTIQTLDRAVRRARPERHHRALARRRSPDTAACVQRLPLPEEQLIGRLKSKITNSVGDVKEDFPRILCRWPPCCRPQAWILIDRVIYRCNVSRRSRRRAVGDASCRITDLAASMSPCPRSSPFYYWHGIEDGELCEFYSVVDPPAPQIRSRPVSSCPGPLAGPLQDPGSSLRRKRVCAPHEQRKRSTCGQTG